MKQFLKVYNVTLHAEGPVFIGSGEKIEKKEYIFLKDEQKVVIPDIPKMQQFLSKKRLNAVYEDYIMNDSRSNLAQWLREQGITKADIMSWARYQLDCGDAIWERGKQMQVMACIKDAYGCPYVPGSSIKGMIRTLLLAHDIRKYPENYEQVKKDILRELDHKSGRNNYLNYETRILEEIAFHKAGRTDRKSDMTNDFLSGIIVSDSKPLSTDDLTLCQKVEYHKDGRETRLPLLRECIKPGIDIHFTISIDTSVCPLTIQDIESSIKQFAEDYYVYFSKKYPKIPKPEDNTVWLGGGSGYVSKTVIYALFNDRGIQIIPAIFENTGVPRNHGHSKDVGLGVAPHILKLTKYQGQNYQFGESTLEFEEVV